MSDKTAFLGIAGFLTGFASACLAGVVTMNVMVSHESETKSQIEHPISFQSIF